MEPRQISDIVKVYPHMLKIVIYHNDYQLFSSDNSERKERKAHAKEDALHRSVRRTKTTISDIIACNSFELWCTFTFDRRKVDRFDMARCRRVMSTWLNRQKVHSPKLEYLIVPEFHKKCQECSETKAKDCPHDDRPKALHFHAFMRGFRGPLKATKARQHTKTVYSFTGYRSGRSHCVYIGNDPAEHRKVGQYMQKYITKDMPLIHGKKRFWTSQGLQRPTTHVNGLTHFNLWSIVKNNAPVYINQYLELQEVHTNTPIDLVGYDRQVALNIGVERLKKLRCQKDTKAANNYAHLLQ